MQEHRRTGWYTLGGAIMAAGALWLTGWGIAVGQSSSPLRYWIPASFAAVAVCAAGLIIILAVMYDWPGRWEKRAAPTTAAVTPESVAAASEPEATAVPGPPVDIRLKPERDMTTDRFRLGALNRGDLGSFRAEVIAIRTQDGWEPVVTQGGWPVPWLEDGSVTSREIPKFSHPRLDFAHFSMPNLREDLDGTKWLRGDHWVFPSRPEPIKVRYPAVRTWPEQDDHYFLVTVRVIRDDPPGHADTQFKIGTEGTEPYCREHAAASVSSASVSPAPDASSEPLVLAVETWWWKDWSALACYVKVLVRITNASAESVSVAHFEIECDPPGDSTKLKQVTINGLVHTINSERADHAKWYLAPRELAPHASMSGWWIAPVYILPGRDIPRCEFVVTDAAGRRYRAAIPAPDRQPDGTEHDS